MNYEPSSDQRQCEPKNISKRAETLSYIFLGVASLGIISNILLIIFFKQSAMSLSGVIFHFQMLALLPQIGSKMEGDGIDFIRNLKFLMFSFKELQFEWTFLGYYDIKSQFGYPQQNKYLYLINLESASSIVNLYSILWISGVVTIMFSIGAFLAFTNISKTVGNKIISLTCIGGIKLFMFSFVFILLASLSEITESKNFENDLESFIISCGIILSCIGFMISSVYAWILALKRDDSQMPSWTSGFFGGMKEGARPRFFIIIWIFRKIVLVSLIQLLGEFSNMAKCGIFITAQLIYIGSLVMLSPFSSLKDSILEVFGEIAFLSLIPSSIYLSPLSSDLDHTMIYLSITGIFTTVTIGKS